MRRPLLLATALIVSFAAQAEPYANARFGTSIEVPAIFTTLEQESDNGDGQIWSSEDGARMWVYGQHNVLDHTAKSFAEDLGSTDGRQVTYRTGGKSWAVVSGTDGTKIFYARCELGASGTMHTVLIEYPTALRAEYDAKVPEIANSLNGP